MCVFGMVQRCIHAKKYERYQSKITLKKCQSTLSFKWNLMCWVTKCLCALNLTITKPPRYENGWSISTSNKMSLTDRCLCYQNLQFPGILFSIKFKTERILKKKQTNLKFKYLCFDVTGVVGRLPSFENWQVILNFSS